MCIEALPDHLKSVEAWKIKLSNGTMTIIDEDTYKWASKCRWSYGCRGYAHRRKNYKIEYLHRLILKAKPNEIGDHINGDTLDNRRSNLRIVNKSLNNLNRHNLDRRSTTGFTGVYFHKKKHYWYGQFRYNGVEYYVPSQPTSQQVANLRTKMIKEATHALVCPTRTS